VRWAPLDLDGRKAALGDTKGKRAVVLVAAPDRQGVGGADLLDQALGEELADELLGRSALQIRGELDAAILALRGGGQEYELRIGELHWDPPFGWYGVIAVTSEAPRWQASRRGRIPETRLYRLVKPTYTTALFAAKSQSFLDYLLADCWPN
jgi:hypothetical protein